MKEKILKIYTDFKLRKKTLSFFGGNQYSDWKIILLLFLVASFAAIVLSFFSYFYTGESVDLFNSEQNIISVKKIKKEVLESVIIKMEERQKNFESLQINKPLILDPSL